MNWPDLMHINSINTSLINTDCIFLLSFGWDKKTNQMKNTVGVDETKLALGHQIRISCKAPRLKQWYT